MTFRSSQLRRSHGVPNPLAAAAFTARRMSVSGKKILDENGKYWCPRGVNYGHGELGVDGDAQEIADRGFNSVRIIPRKWGTYSGSTTDSDANGATTEEVLTSYFDTVRLRVLQAKAAGLKVLLAFDSNCGQTERVADTTCALGLGSPQTFWTTGGATKLDQHVNQIRYYARALCGLVDFWEPIVEPNPAATIPSGDLHTDVWAVQDRIRNVILAEDPGALFIIGPAPSYQNSALSGWFNSAWDSQSNTIYTNNELSNAMTNGGGSGMPNDISNLVSMRSTNKVPVVIQQMGTTLTDDPDGSLLVSGATLLNQASGGSIGWWYWEWVSQNSNSYGPYSGNPGARALNTTRMSQLQALAAAPVTQS